MVSTLKLTKIQIPNSDSDVISLDASTGNVTLNKTLGGTSITVQGEGTATINLQQGLAKGWINYTQAATFVTNDSFNISSVNDDGAGLADTNYTNNFGNANYVASGASGRVNLTGSDAYWTFPTRGSSSVYSTSSTSWTSGYNPTSDGLTAADCVLNICTFHGDSA